MDLLKQIYSVFGDTCPTRSDYSATQAKPFPALTVTKAYRTWRHFSEEYNKYVAIKKAEAAKAKVITKKGKEDV